MRGQSITLTGESLGMKSGKEEDRNLDSAHPGKEWGRGGESVCRHEQSHGSGPQPRQLMIFNGATVFSKLDLVRGITKYH